MRWDKAWTATKKKKAEIIVYDVGSTYTKISAFARAAGELVYLGRAQAPTTIENIIVGLQNAKYSLLTEREITNNGGQEIYATSSAAGGLRMVAMGLYAQGHRQSRQRGGDDRRSEGPGDRIL